MYQGITLNSDKEVEDALSQPPLKKKTLHREVADVLKELYGVTDQEINELLLAKSRPSNSRDGAAHTKALRRNKPEQD